MQSFNDWPHHPGYRTLHSRHQRSPADAASHSNVADHRDGPGRWAADSSALSARCTRQRSLGWTTTTDPAGLHVVPGPTTTQAAACAPAWRDPRACGAPPQAVYRLDRRHARTGRGRPGARARSHAGRHCVHAWHAPPYAHADVVPRATAVDALDDAHHALGQGRYARRHIRGPDRPRAFAATSARRAPALRADAGVAIDTPPGGGVLATDEHSCMHHGHTANRHQLRLMPGQSVTRTSTVASRRRRWRQVRGNARHRERRRPGARVGCASRRPSSPAPAGTRAHPAGDHTAR